MFLKEVPQIKFQDMNQSLSFFYMSLGVYLMLMFYSWIEYNLLLNVWLSDPYYTFFRSEQSSVLEICIAYAYYNVKLSFAMK